MTFKNDNISALLFRNIPLFVEAVKLKSFTKAADGLNLPLPTFSRRISAMEKTLGFPIFYRKGPRFELTEYGRLLYERCQYMVTEVEEALGAISRDSLEPKGTIRVVVHAHIYHAYMAGAVESFARKWPAIQFDIQMAGTSADLATKSYDIEITGGSIPNPDLKVRKLLSVSPFLYASPQLIEKFGMPSVPEDLASMPCIALTQVGRIWPMTRGEETRIVEVRLFHTTDSPLVARELVRAGAGVAMLIAPLAAEDEKKGNLMKLLPGWTVPEVEISAVRPPVQPPKRVRLFLDHLVEYFTNFVK